MTEEQTHNYGLTVHQGQNGNRLEMECVHQNGVLYAIPSEASWVCSQDLLHVHALAGFFRELTALEGHRIQELMQRWGIFFRPRPIADQGESQG